MPHSDSDIWSAVLDGEDLAWKQLVRRYQPLVYTIALRAGLSMADAADCFQQTWLSLYQNKHKITDPSRVSAWLTTTAKREAIRLSKKARSNVGETQVGEQVDESLLPDEEMEDLERQALIKNAISHLDKRCRKLINLMFFSPDDVSYEKIAEKLNIAFNSLGPIRRRCLTRLKQILADLGHIGVRDDTSGTL